MSGFSYDSHSHQEKNAKDSNRDDAQGRKVTSEFDSLVSMFIASSEDMLGKCIHDACVRMVRFDSSSGLKGKIFVI